ncbi:MAG: rod-binding protein [Treponema sp.]|nr:rod-binding protein [Treponema sp.]
MTGLNVYNPMRQTVGAVHVMQPGRLNGDYGSGFAGTFTSELDKHAAPVGAAANQASLHGQPRTIDRTSELYEKSMEMESYIVKQMLSSMRKTVMRANGEQNYAEQMYEDMLYDEYAVQMTKSAGFGLADQLYLQLSAGETGGVDITA